MKLFFTSMIVFVLTNTLCHAQETKQPNIIFIMADDLGVHDLGAFGQKLIKTPRIDQLAGEGTRFTQFYAGASVCAPSRSVLMTGLHTGHTRVRGNMSKVGGVLGESGEKGRVPLKDEDVTVAEVLKSAGYTTGITGKWGLGEGHNNGTPNRQGFDQWFGYLNQNQAHSYYQSSIWLNDEKFDLVGNLDGRRTQYTHDLFTGFALNFIRTNQSRPFFLYLPYTIPHATHEVPELGNYADENWPNEAKAYAAMVTRLDRHVGLVLDLLDELKLRENTIVFFCSDNGGPAPFNEIFETNGILRGKKGQLYEGGLRSPMIVRWPGHVKSGEVSDAVWYLADVLPTLADIADARSPSSLDGVSLLPTLQGNSQELQNRFLYWEQTSNGFEQAVRYGNWKAVRHKLNGPIELFNLLDDPSEKQDVANENKDVVQKIAEYLKTAHVESPDWPVEELSKSVSQR